MPAMMMMQLSTQLSEESHRIPKNPTESQRIPLNPKQFHGIQKSSDVTGNLSELGFYICPCPVIFRAPIRAKNVSSFPDYLN